MDTATVLAAILAGDLDDDIFEVFEALKQRHKAIGKKRFDNLKVGDRVRLNADAGQYAGMIGTIEAKRRTNVDIVLDDGMLVTGNPALVEVV